MDVTFLETEPFFPSPVPNSARQGEIHSEEPNWLRLDWARVNEAEIHDHAEVNNEEEVHEREPHIGLDVSVEIEPDPREVSTLPEAERDTPHASVPEGPPPEDIPEVNSPTIPPNSSHMDTSVDYTLPFRHNRGKPPSRYSPDVGE